MQYQFDAELATQYGVDEAIFVHRIYWWVRQNRANNRNFKDGHYWTHDSVQALISKDVFGFWTRRQLERIIKSCTEKGLILTADYNTDRRARPLWYTVTDKVFAFYETVPDPKPDPDLPPPSEEPSAPEPPNSEYGDSAPESIPPNGGIDSTNRGNALHETVEPIPPNGGVYYKEQLVDTVSRQRGSTRTRKKKFQRPADPDLKIHGEFKHVLLSDDQLGKLVALWPDTVVRGKIDDLDEYLEMHPEAFYANHYATLRNWLRSDHPLGDRPKNPTAPPAKPSGRRYEEW